MAFWGIYVGPEEPYVLKPRGRRLHISQATLSDQCEDPIPRSVLQCVVRNQPPILICSLSMKEMHCRQLDLEFEECEDVIFSVSGPRGIHLSGYYLAPSPVVAMRSSSAGLHDFKNGFYSRYNAKYKGKFTIASEEDIGDTDSFTDGSNEENSYDFNDSFIDDSAATPLAQQEYSTIRVNGKIVDDDNPKKGKSSANPHKRNLLLELESETSSQGKNAVSRKTNLAKRKLWG